MIEVLFGKQDNLLRTAQESLFNGNLNKARELLLDLKTTNPSNPIPVLYLSLVEDYDNNFELANQLINEALDIKDTSETQVFIFFKAIILFDQKNYREAAQSLDDSSSETNYFKFLSDLCKVSEDFNNIETNQAKQTLETFLSFSKGSLDIQARAIELLESKIKTDYANRASHASLPNEFQPMIFSEKRIQNAKNNVTNQLKEIDQYLNNNALIKAVELIDKAQDSGVLLIDIEKKQRDLGHYINDNIETSIKELGILESLKLLTQAGYYESVIKISLESLEKESNANGIHHSEDFYQLHELLGISFFSLKNYQKAITHFNQIISRKGFNNSLSIYFLAASYTHLNQRYESIQYYKSFILSSLDSYETAIKLNLKTIFPDLLIT